MVSRSRSSVRMRSRSVARKSRSPMRSKSPRKSKSPARKMRSKSPRKSMRKSKSPRKSMRKMRSKSPRRLSARKSVRKAVRKSPKTEFAKWRAAHRAEINAEMKARGHTGKGSIKFYTKVAKDLAAKAGVKVGGGSRKKATSAMRRTKVSALRKLRTPGISQSAEQKLRALFSRSPSRYTISKKGTRVMKKRSMRKMKSPKLTKTGKMRKTRAMTPRNMFFKQHKAEIAAEVMRRGMTGKRGATLIVGNEMAKASGL
jgi:hypothetical protein